VTGTSHGLTGPACRPPRFHSGSLDTPCGQSWSFVSDSLRRPAITSSR
jgi:hypothetical protein